VYNVPMCDQIYGFALGYTVDWCLGELEDTHTIVIGGDGPHRPERGRGGCLRCFGL